MRSYIEAEKTLGNRPSRKLENNTYLQRRDPSTIAVKLHDTDVVVYHVDGSVSLYSGGYRTVTTKDRINSYSPQWITQQRGVWYIGKEDSLRIFEDGITVMEDGSIQGGREVVKGEDQKVIRECRRYAREYVKAMEDGKVNAPSGGDCWDCALREVTSNRPMGEVSGHSYHIKSHMEEKYYVPSLLARAIEVFPVSQFAM